MFHIGASTKATLISRQACKCFPAADTPACDSNGTEVLDQKQEEMSGLSYSVFPPWQYAQSFTPTLTTLTQASLCMWKEEGTPDEWAITVSLKENLMGDDLTSVTKMSNILPTTEPQWIPFDFPDITVIPETTYYLVIKTSAGSTTHTACLCYQYGNPYNRGSGWGSNDNGFQWIILDKYLWDYVDFTFRIYGLDYPPAIPTINGTIQGNQGTPYPYTLTTSDPEGYNVSYFVEWGDGTNSSWLGPYPSGEEISVTHTWIQKGTYTIRVKARDMFNVESEWTTLKVTMPTHNSIIHHKPISPILSRTNHN